MYQSTALQRWSTLLTYAGFQTFFMLNVFQETRIGVWSEPFGIAAATLGIIGFVLSLYAESNSWKLWRVRNFQRISDEFFGRTLRQTYVWVVLATASIALLSKGFPEITTSRTIGSIVMTWSVHIMIFPNVTLFWQKKRQRTKLKPPPSPAPS